MERRIVAHSERVIIIEKKLQGMSVKQIAQEHQLNWYTVRRWWRRYRDGGWEGLISPPSQRPAEGVLSTFDPMVGYVALRLKRAHPGWGADVILLKLRQRASLVGKKLPSRSTLSAYLQPYLQRIKGNRRVTQRPPVPRLPVTQAHECWQMDFKGAEQLGSCGSFAPFMVVDALTSAPLHTHLYPGTLKGVGWRDVQHALRTVFTQWGLPDFLRMDRGSIFVGSTRLEWPSGLLLWLVGLGVNPIINRPYRPTDNAQVERQNGVWQQHVANGATFTTQVAAQRATDQARHDRLTHLPSRNPVCQGQAPLVACPDLLTPRRVYQPDHEADYFDWERVALYLSDWRWLRQVDSTGCISLANRHISVGRVYAEQAVAVHFDLDADQFVAQACDDAGTSLRQFSLPEVTPTYLMHADTQLTHAGG